MSVVHQAAQNPAKTKNKVNHIKEEEVATILVTRRFDNIDSAVIISSAYSKYKLKSFINYSTSSSLVIEGDCEKSLRPLRQ